MPKVNLKGCKDAILEIAKDTLSDDEAEGFVKALEQRIGNIDQANIANLEEKIKQASTELSQDINKVALINKRNALYSFKAKNELVKYGKTWANPFEGILAFLEDSRKGAMEAAGRGVNAIVEGYKSKYLGELKAMLTKGGVLNEFRRDTLEKEIYKEFYEPGSSGSEKARKIRDIMTALKQDAVSRQNLYGSFIHFLPEHVKRQVYSPALIKKMFGPERFSKFINLNRFLTPEEYDETFKKFADFMTPLIDSEKTFKDSDPQKFLRGAFDGVMSGRHGPIQQASGAEISTNFFRAGALAKQASTERLIHFKDGDSAYKAYSALSDEPISKGFVTELEHAATNIGLMQQMGPNPKGTLDEAIKGMEYEFSRAGDEKKLKQLQDNKHRLYSALSFLDRSAMIPQNPTLQTATATAISLLSQAKLGKLFFFALPDRALIQSTLTRNGMKGMDALTTSLRMSKPTNPDERLRLMMMGGELKSFINSINTRFSTGAEAGVPSAVLTAQKYFFNLTGINWLDDIGTDAIVGALPRHLGAMADRSFDKIVPEMRQMFKLYGITEKDWDAWRSTAYGINKDGSMTPLEAKSSKFVASVMAPFEQTSQATGEKAMMPGMVQIDEFNARGENIRSTNPEKLREEGYDVPSREDLFAKGQGKHDLGEFTTSSKYTGDDRWITPDQFDKIPNEVIDSMLADRDMKVTEGNRIRQRDLLENKFRTWLTAQKDEGVLMPGSKEHRLATFGTQAGTVPGSLARLIMMFKTFPITVYTKIMQREMYGNGARTFTDWLKGEYHGNFHATQLIAMSTIAGYLSLTVDELLQGKNPRSFTDRQGNIDVDSSLATLRDSFLRGNAVSLFGDLLLREYDTGYQNILSQLGGPAVNEFVRGTSLMSQSIHGKANPKDYVDFLKRNTPWVNMFYVKPALDYLIWFNVQEMLDPGSLRRQEMNHKERYNQTYWASPNENRL